MSIITMFKTLKREFFYFPLCVVGGFELSRLLHSGENFVNMSKLKDIPWYEGRYAITEYGEVWSYPKNTNNKLGKFIKQGKAWKYNNLALQTNWKGRAFNVHRLVAITYIPNPYNLPIVHHIDNNKVNNHVSNLMWETHKGNTQRAYDEWLCPRTEKQMELSKKLWLMKSKKIMQLTKDGEVCNIYNSTNEAGRITWFQQTSIASCWRWKLKTCWGYRWEYL